MMLHKVFSRHRLLKYNSEKSTAKSDALENYISSANLSLAGCSSAEPDSVSVGGCKFQTKKLYLQTVKKVDHLPSDTDIIFGNLRNFLDDETLSYDYISVRDDYPSGYFSVFKNENKINLLYTLSKDYKELFLKEDNTLFEECGGAYSEVCNGVNILNSSCIYETFHHVLEKNKDNLKILFELFSIEGNVGEIKVLHEKLVFMKKFEIMMYHLTSYKTNLFSIIPTKLLKPAFYINQYNFKKSKYGFSNIFINLKKIYLFYISKFISLSIKENIILNGNFIYMDEIINVNNNVFRISNLNLSYNIKKIPFLNLYRLNNYIIKIISSNKFEVFSLNGNKKTYTFVK